LFFSSKIQRKIAKDNFKYSINKEQIQITITNRNRVLDVNGNAINHTLFFKENKNSKEKQITVSKDIYDKYNINDVFYIIGETYNLRTKAFFLVFPSTAEIDINSYTLFGEDFFINLDNERQTFIQSVSDNIINNFLIAVVGIFMGIIIINFGDEFFTLGKTLFEWKSEK